MLRDHLIRDAGVIGRNQGLGGKDQAGRSPEIPSGCQAILDRLSTPDLGEVASVHELRRSRQGEVPIEGGDVLFQANVKQFGAVSGSHVQSPVRELREAGPRVHTISVGGIIEQMDESASSRLSSRLGVTWENFEVTNLCL